MFEHLAEDDEVLRSAVGHLVVEEIARDVLQAVPGDALSMLRAHVGDGALVAVEAVHQQRDLAAAELEDARWSSWSRWRNVFQYRSR